MAWLLVYGGSRAPLAHTRTPLLCASASLSHTNCSSRAFCLRLGLLCLPRLRRNVRLPHRHLSPGPPATTPAGPRGSRPGNPRGCAGGLVIEIFWSVFYVSFDNNFPPLFPFPARKGLYRYHFCFFCRFAIALSISVPAGSLGRISGWAEAYQLGSLLGCSTRQGLLTRICTSLYCLRTCANQDLSRSAKACAELSANTPMLPANVLTQAQQRTQLQQQTRSSSNNCKAIKRGRHDDGHALAAAAAVVVQ